MFLDQNTPPESKTNVLESSFSHPDMVLDTRCTSGVPRRPLEMWRSIFPGSPSKTTPNHHLTSTVRPNTRPARTFADQRFPRYKASLFRNPFQRASFTVPLKHTPRVARLSSADGRRPLRAALIAGRWCGTEGAAEAARSVAAVRMAHGKDLGARA